MKKFVKRYIGLILTILFASLFFMGLFHWNNKYTHPAPQAENGFLDLTKEDLAQYPLRFLCRGWEFYPNLLLAPEDLPSASSAYMHCITIGDSSFLGNRPDETTHGCGSYAMHLLLPEEEHSYALELPEIFSAYRLYINGRLMLEMGNPDPDSYLPLTQNRMVYFDASGSADILIAVSDYSHFYSGMVYPPAFGTPLALNTSRGIRFAVYMVMICIGCIAIFLSLYLGIKMVHKNTLLFALLCLAMCGFSSYGLLHTMCAFPVFPWYALELASGYLVTCLLVILHNRICRISFRLSAASNGIAAGFCVLALLYGLCSAHLTSPVIRLFSLSVSCYKAIVAFYLLGTAYYSVRRERSADSGALFCASVIYAMSFLWDRIYPSFEPVYGGWFAEWGALSLVCAVGCTLWRKMLRDYANALSFSEQYKQAEKQLAMQMLYSQQITAQMDEKRRLIHDFRQQLRAMENLSLNAGTPEGRQELLDFIHKADRSFTEGRFASIPDFCQNAAVNALLRYYYTAAADFDIEIHFSFSFPTACPLSDVELCTVLGNLLENGLEACKRQPSASPRSLSLNSKETAGTFFILIENSYDGKLKKMDGRFLSMKTGTVRFGIGLESAKEILKRYGGTIDLFPEKNVFKAGISIPLNSP